MVQYPKLVKEFLINNSSFLLPDPYHEDFSWNRCLAYLINGGSCGSYITLYSDSGVQNSEDEATYEVETHRLSGDDTKMGKDTQAPSLMAPRCREVPDQPEQPERRPEEQQSRILTDIRKKMHSAV